MKTISRIRSNTIKRDANPKLPNDKVVSGFVAAPEKVRYGQGELKSRIIAIYPEPFDWCPFFSFRIYSEAKGAATYGNGAIFPLIPWSSSSIFNFNEARFLKISQTGQSYFASLFNKEGLGRIQDSGFTSYRIRKYNKYLSLSNRMIISVGSYYLLQDIAAHQLAKYPTSPNSVAGTPYRIFINTLDQESNNLFVSENNKKRNKSETNIRFYPRTPKKYETNVTTFYYSDATVNSPAVNNIGYPVNTYTKVGLTGIALATPYELMGGLHYNNLNGVSKQQVKRYLEQRNFRFKQQ